MPQDEMLRHVELSKAYPRIKEEKGRPPLAVLGGGHSALKYVEEVRAFKGERWIVGSSFQWWKSQGIDGRFFSVHPSTNALKNIDGVTDAVLASVTHPEVLKALGSAKVELFDIESCGTTSVTAALYPAVTCGYPHVTLYGFDSSYRNGSHVYMDVKDPWQVVVECDGKEYLTGAEFLKQAEYLAMAVCAAPKYFTNRSEGLLAAMIRSKGEYEPVRATKEFLSTVIFEERVNA